MKILIVDDNPTNRKYLTTLIEKNTNYIAIEAVNGQEAVDFIKGEQNKADLIIMDIKMPKMGGQEATRQIRTFQINGSRIPIIKTTGHSSFFGEDELFDGFLPLPINKNAFLSLVKKLLEQKNHENI